MSNEKKNVSVCFLVGFDISENDNAVAIIGKKGPGIDIEVINAFSGEEAIALYNKLNTKKEKKK
jgi:hypothetical protein